MHELGAIMHRAAQAKSSLEHRELIVNAICDVLQTDVCSIYLRNPNGDMAMLVSRGLESRHPHVIPAGKGIVGLVVAARHTINISEPEKHPAYYYLARSNEEQFHSFCGVPMVRAGQVIGVLVVQSRRPDILDPEREAFLTTLAAHLALVMERVSAEASAAPVNMVLRGISGAPGVAIGPVHVRSSGHLDSVPEEACDDPAAEVERWHRLRDEVTDELKAEEHKVEQALGSNLATVIEAYRMLLEDPAFNTRIATEIHGGLTLLSAIRRSVRYFSDQFQAMDDPYLRARHEDIEQLGEKLYATLLRDGEVVAEVYDGPCVLVGTHISVSDIARIPAEHLQAIVCQGGAALSHIAVFANALGIPAVMGVGDLPHLAEDELVIVDGSAGEVVRFPTEALCGEYQAVIRSRRALDERLSAIRDLPAQTTDGTRIELLVNSGLQADIMPGIRAGADGIGLFRTEIPFMASSSLPSEEEQLRLYEKVIAAYDQRPVYMRTLDIGSDKPLPYLPPVQEENPALGWRGVRFTLDNVQLLMTQVRAILRAAGERDTLHLLFPMVVSSHELDQCISLVDDACQQLTQEGRKVRRPRLGVMLEIPGAVSLLPFWKHRIDFVSIGSNDLSQYLLAIDRNSPLVGKLYDPLHPAVLHEMKRILDRARELDLPVSICGEMASDPISVAVLIGFGARRLSMSSARLPLIRYLVRAMSIAKARQFAETCLQTDSAGVIRAQGRVFIDSLGLELDGPALSH